MRPGILRQFDIAGTRKDGITAARRAVEICVVLCEVCVHKSLSQ
jgi:hypothetical protein